MRPIPEAMSAAITSGATTFAHVWRITRGDGAVFGFTDHDRPLAFDAITCTPSTALTPGVIEKSTALSIDSASISGALSDEAITEADLKCGLWDGARVDLFRVDWRDASARVHLFAGTIGAVKRGAAGFEAELRGLQAPLNVPVGRVFSRFCDADLGDVRCARDVSGAAFTGAGVVSDVISTVAFRATGLSAYAEGWFTRGRVNFNDGSVGEVASHRSQGADAIIELLDPIALNTGDAFAIVAGCDKSFESCRTRFANALNFRGFPHMPGNDAVQAGPSRDAKLDGGSRFS